MPVPFVADGLRKLADLRDRGVLSAAEFEQQKARLLDRSTSAPEASPELHPSRRARWLAAAAVVFLVLLAGAVFAVDKQHLSAHARKTTQRPITTTTMAAITAPAPTSQQLPITMSRQLSSSSQDPSILAPSSCTLSNGVLIAEGTINGGFVPEGYARDGDVIELYAYSVGWTSTDQSPAGVQVADLTAERPGNLADPWQVSAPANLQLGTPIQCVVAVQSTHAFQGAP